MRLSFILLLLPTLASAQFGQNCTWKTTFTYDAAGNRIRRMEACVTNPPVSQSGTPGNRLPAPAAALTLQLYPNPGEGAFTMEFSSAVTHGSMEVFDLNGKLVVNRSFEGKIIPVDLTEHAAGIYFIRIQADGELFEQKWLKY